jgi:hypothetical protein
MSWNCWRRTNRHVSARPHLEALEERNLPALLLATNGTQLLAFDSATPQSIQTRVSVIGLKPGEFLQDIDFRPATGQLYGLSNQSRLYFLDPRSGAASQVGPNGAFNLGSVPFGFDFNPVTGVIRIVTPAGTNLRVNPDTGKVVGVDPNLAYASGDSGAGQTPDVTDIAYSNSVAGAATTHLFGIDSARNALVQIDGGTGTLTTVGAPASVPFEALDSFDIHTAGTDNTGYVLRSRGLQPNGGLPNFWEADTINLSTGGLTTLGPIGTGQESITGLAAVPSGEEPRVLGPQSTVGAFDPATATWYLRSSNTSGAANAGVFQYGGAGWIGVVGDWDGNGSQTVGVVDPLGDIDPNNLTWFLRNSNSAGAPDAGVFNFGSRGWIPVVGDWTGSGRAGIGAFDPTTATWYLRNNPSPGAPDFVFQYGAAGWIPVVGDWTGDGVDTVGVVDPTGASNASDLVWFLRNSNSAGAPDFTPFNYGPRTWKPITGNWNGPSGLTTVGVVDTTGASNPTQLVWYLRFQNDSGPPDITPFNYGSLPWQPVAGAYNFPLGL